MKSKTDVCGVEHVKWLDNGFRRMIHNPQRMFGSFVRPGSVVFDIGCGPGAFTAALAGMVGPAGTVVAIDVQEAMLDIARSRIAAAGLNGRVVFHRSTGDTIGIERKADFIVTFYMVHESPDPMHLVDEVAALLNPGGYWYCAEPKMHVSDMQYREVVDRGVASGLAVVKQTGFISRVAVFQK